MKSMRCKVEITAVEGRGTDYETIRARPVARNDGYPDDGSDEDNTFAKFSPSGDFELTIANPALLGVYERGQRFYVDWTPVPAAAEQAQA